MRVSGFLSGGSPIVKRYQVSVTVGTAGVPLIGGATTTAGIAKATTTSLAGFVGLPVDTVTYSTTQLGNASGGGGGQGQSGAAGGGASTAGAYLGVIINPDLLITARLNQGATSGTALTSYSNTSASAGGTVITAAVGSNTVVDGTVWCLTGANAGQSRIVTAWSSNVSLTVTVPFDYAIAVGDTFAHCPTQPFGGVGTADELQFSTDLTEVDSSIAVGTGAVATTVELFLRDASDNGVNNSWVTFSPAQNHQLYTV